MTGEVGTIYLIHFHSNFKHARHYLGWTSDLESRLKAHANGNGSKLMSAVSQAGISHEIARLWIGTRDDERRLKKRKESPALCPICSQSPKPVGYLPELDISDLRALCAHEI